MPKEWIVSEADLGMDGAYFSYTEVVRCKDCTYYQEGFRGEHWCTKHSSAYSIMQWGVKEDDYCSWAEREEDAEEE